MLGRTRKARLPRFTFVVTYGRSGSTLLQGLLNTLPNTLVRGENGLFVLPLFRSYATINGYHRKYGRHGARKGVQSAFYGLDEFSREDFIERSRELVLPQLYGKVKPSKVDVLGFKEVVWYRVRPRETQGFFNYLDQVFPDARYILHRRAHESVRTSGFWRREDADSVAQALTRVEEVQDFLAESRPDRTLWTRYEQLTSPDPAVVDQQLQALAEFVVGDCDDALMSRLRSTLRVGYGPRTKGRKDKKGKPAKPGKRGRRAGAAEETG